MRLSRKVWIVLGIIVFVVLAIILGTTYSSQVGERRDLTNQLTVAQNRLPVLTGEKETLEGRLGTAKSAVDEAATKYPRSVESIEYGEDLFRIAGLFRQAADGLDVKVMSLTASVPSARDTGGVIYSVSSFTIVVTGDVENMLKFIDAVCTQIHYKLTWSFQEPWSIQVNTVTMTRADATINLDIYGYKR